MAKKTRARVSQDAPAGAVFAAQAENKLEDFAEDLGRMLGQAQNKAESWLGQRKAIADHLIGLRDTATQLLAQLGVSDAPRRGRRPGRPAASAQRTGSASTKGRKKKRTMSAEARARIAAAQRARWAKQKAQK
jgi:hypothetical protein